MNALKKTVLRRLGIEDDHPWLVGYQNAKRRMLGKDAKLRDRYFKQFETTKLHLGSSNHLLKGWLNTDLCPGKDVMMLDATASYPFESDSFDFVYSEHMIEHLPYDAALKMLKECHRVLKPGGVIRIVTPDLAKILNIYPQPKDSLGERYLDWMSTTFTPGVSENQTTHVVNSFFRLWGHQFLYDAGTLTTTLIKCGFTNIGKHELGTSHHIEMQKLENTKRYPEGLLHYESICFEASKPKTLPNPCV